MLTAAPVVGFAEPASSMNTNDAAWFTTALSSNRVPLTALGPKFCGGRSAVAVSDAGSFKGASSSTDGNCAAWLTRSAESPPRGNSQAPSAGRL